MTGGTVYFAEAIGFSRPAKQLYVSASINGSIAGGDYCSESLMRVDTATAGCTLITTFTSTASNPEADILAFDNSGLLYYSDGAPPNANFLNYYTMDVNNPSLSSPFYSSSYAIQSDFSIVDDKIYFSEDRILKYYDLMSNNIYTVGQMFTNSDFNEDLVDGIS